MSRYLNFPVNVANFSLTGSYNGGSYSRVITVSEGKSVETIYIRVQYTSVNLTPSLYDIDFTA